MKKIKNIILKKWLAQAIKPEKPLKFTDKVKSLIKECYQYLVRKENFIIQEKIVKVKKGKARYILCFLETTSGIRKIVISRHSKTHVTDLEFRT